MWQASKWANKQSSCAWYLLSVLLVFAFAHSFPIWQGLLQPLGETWTAVGIVTATAAGIGGGFLMVLRNQSVAVESWKFIALGCGVAILGLALTDPQYPAKRIHVLEYFLLTLVVRRAMAPDMDGISLSVLSIAAAIFLAVHDELIQGLLPSRTFGVRDIFIDTLGVVSATFFAVGVKVRKDHQAQSSNAANPVSALYFGTLLTAGIALTLIPLAMFQFNSVPVWVVLPALGAVTATVLMFERKHYAISPTVFCLILAASVPIPILLSHVPFLVFQ